MEKSVVTATRPPQFSPPADEVESPVAASTPDTVARRRSLTFLLLIFRQNVRILANIFFILKKYLKYLYEHVGLCRILIFVLNDLHDRLQ